MIKQTSTYLSSNKILNPDLWTLWHNEKYKTRIFTPNKFKKNTKPNESPKIEIPQ